MTFPFQKEQETAQANLRKPTDAIKRGHFVILEQFTTAVI